MRQERCKGRTTYCPYSGAGRALWRIERESLRRRGDLGCRGLNLTREEFFLFLASDYKWIDERAKEGRHEKRSFNPRNLIRAVYGGWRTALSSQKNRLGDIKPVEHMRRKQRKWTVKSITRRRIGELIPSPVISCYQWTRQISIQSCKSLGSVAAPKAQRHN